PRGLGCARGQLRRDRVALEGTPPTDADLQVAHAFGGERNRAAARVCGVLPVLPVDALHAAGAPLLRDQDGGRIHWPDRLDRRVLGGRADAGNANRRSSRAARRTASLCGRARSLRAAPSARALLLGRLPCVPP